MTRLLNPFTFALLAVATALVYLLSNPPGGTPAFYGFVESQETEINYNYPVAISEILVRPGQAVDSGQALLRLVHRELRDELADEPYQLSELAAQETAWRKERQQQLDIIAGEASGKLAEIDTRITTVEEEIAYRQSLTEGLSSISVPEGNYQPLRAELRQLRAERKREAENYRLQRAAIENELRYGTAPYREQAKRLRAEADFSAINEERSITLHAPAAGLIGNINCREGEFKSAFANLITFYEPHVDIVRAYVHEDQAVTVRLGDLYEVSSAGEPVERLTGTVIGLGSRIVEIPERLRKYVELRSYGREVTLSISTKNTFLQQEKVSLRRRESAAR